MKPSLRLLGALFVAMALVCAATLVTAFVRISAADDKATQLSGDLERTRTQLRTFREEADATSGKNQHDLRAVREQTLDIDPTALQRSLAFVADSSVTLPVSTCTNFDTNCQNNQTVSLRLSRCGSQPCVYASKWHDSTQSLSLGSDTWTGQGTVPSGKVLCSGVNVSGVTWKFTARVTAAQYSIAGGWKPGKVEAVFSIDIPATTCSTGMVVWKGSAALK
ncbi:hypothetical protein AB0K00_27390 [Dactylosporangium sp. NPDC049525]|uniref:hypothetical protein n=1 Tax=Dactylosporangium sp. NPDC049525 TaxID=3154730 RepID=UPI00343E9DBD